MSARSRGGGIVSEGGTGCGASFPGAPGTGFDSEAVENFAEFLAILREWEEEERGKTSGDDANKE